MPPAAIQDGAGAEIGQNRRAVAVPISALCPRGNGSRGPFALIVRQRRTTFRDWRRSMIRGLGFSHDETLSRSTCLNIASNLSLFYRDAYALLLGEFPI
jgi:hypothetical protein